MSPRGSNIALPPLLVLSSLLVVGAALPVPGDDPGVSLPPSQSAPPDTLHLEIGSPEVDGRVFPVHRARNRVYVDGGTTPVTTWTNELVLGDSAGRPVMRWITRGEQLAAGGATWELLQTYDAHTLEPLTYSLTTGAGAETRLRFEGNRVVGTRRASEDAAVEQVDRVLDRRGFFAGASDLIPMAVGLRAGTVMTAPVWSPGMETPEVRVFTVLDRETVEVEGARVLAWKVEERLQSTGRLLATWYLTDRSPYMVLGETVLADGRVRRITGVSLDDSR